MTEFVAQALKPALFITLVATPLPAIWRWLSPPRSEAQQTGTAELLFGGTFVVWAAFLVILLFGAAYEPIENIDGLFRLLFIDFPIFHAGLLALLIGGMGVAIATGRARVVDGLVGLHWEGYMAGLMLTQAFAIFQICNTWEPKGLFQ